MVGHHVVQELLFRLAAVSGEHLRQLVVEPVHELGVADQVRGELVAQVPGHLVDHRHRVGDDVDSLIGHAA